MPTNRSGVLAFFESSNDATSLSDWWWRQRLGLWQLRISPQPIALSNGLDGPKWPAALNLIARIVIGVSLVSHKNSDVRCCCLIPACLAHAGVAPPLERIRPASDPSESASPRTSRVPCAQCLAGAVLGLSRYHSLVALCSPIGASGRIRTRVVPSRIRLPFR